MRSVPLRCEKTPSRRSNSRKIFGAGAYQRPRKPRFISNANETTRSVTREWLTCLSTTAAIPSAIMTIASIRMSNHWHEAAIPHESPPWPSAAALIRARRNDRVQCSVRSGGLGLGASPSRASVSNSSARSASRVAMSLLATPIANSRHFKACFQKKRIRVDINAPATLTPTERQFLSPEHGDYPAFISILRELKWRHCPKLNTSGCECFDIFRPRRRKKAARWGQRCGLRVWDTVVIDHGHTLSDPSVARRQRLRPGEVSAGAEVHRCRRPFLRNPGPAHLCSPAFDASSRSWSRIFSMSSGSSSSICARSVRASRVTFSSSSSFAWTARVSRRSARCMKRVIVQTTSVAMACQSKAARLKDKPCQAVADHDQKRRRMTCQQTDGRRPVGRRGAHEISPVRMKGRRCRSRISCSSRRFRGRGSSATPFAGTRTQDENRVQAALFQATRAFHLRCSQRREAQMPDSQTLLQQASQCRRLAESQTDPSRQGGVAQAGCRVRREGARRDEAPKKSD